MAGSRAITKAEEFQLRSAPFPYLGAQVSGDDHDKMAGCLVRAGGGVQPQGSSVQWPVGHFNQTERSGRDKPTAKGQQNEVVTTKRPGKG